MYVSGHSMGFSKPFSFTVSAKKNAADPRGRDGQDSTYITDALIIRVCPMPSQGLIYIGKVHISPGDMIRLFVKHGGLLHGGPGRIPEDSRPIEIVLFFSLSGVSSCKNSLDLILGHRLSDQVQ